MNGARTRRDLRHEIQTYFRMRTGAGYHHQHRDASNRIVKPSLRGYYHCPANSLAQ
jgi:hypothetical protein